MAVKTAAYYTARIEALYTQLEGIEESAVAEYQTDNAGQRMGVKYRTHEEILRLIKFYERKLAALEGRGGRVLAVFRRGCDG